jgi:hypothetical protein
MLWTHAIDPGGGLETEIVQPVLETAIASIHGLSRTVNSNSILLSKDCYFYYGLRLTPTE